MIGDLIEWPQFKVVACVLTRIRLSTQCMAVAMLHLAYTSDFDRLPS